MLTREDGKLDVTRMSAIVDQIVWLRKHDYEVILVSSGAVAAGRAELHVDHHLDSVEQRQLFSAIGQVKLVGLYYNTVYKIEVRFPSGSEEVQRDYLLSETDRISKSFQRNLAFYQYHRTKATYLDRQYFMRGKPDIQIIVDSFYYETDPQFSTSHDFKVAKILANELLEIYLTNRLHELERREQRKRVKNGFMGKVLRWTGTKRALVELIYALDACGCLNKGTVDIKEIVAYFEYVFDIDLGDFYHTYMELKAKTKDRTGFLSTLKDRLLMRMREQD